MQILIASLLQHAYIFLRQAFVRAEDEAWERLMVSGDTAPTHPGSLLYRPLHGVGERRTDERNEVRTSMASESLVPLFELQQGLEASVTFLRDV